MRLILLLGLLCLSLTRETQGQNEKDVDVSLLKEYLSRSALTENGLFKTVAPVLKDTKDFEALKEPTEEEVREFTAIAEKKFQLTEEENLKLADKDTPNSRTPVFGPHLLTDDKSLEINKPGQITASVTSDIVNNARRKKEREFLDSTARFQIFDLIDRLRFIPVPICPYSKQINCNNAYQYRTIDGRCNNLNNPYWGKSHTPFERFLTPQYEGSSDPRATAQSNLPLPNPRSISLLVHEPSTAADLDSSFSYMVMQWGQFSDHDITKTALSKGYGNTNLQCCTFPGRRDCFPINIPAGDPYYNHTCLNFVRSTVTPALDCSTDYRQQLNELTHFIDASNVYGSSASELSVLRDGLTANLKMSANRRMPLDVNDTSGCKSGANNKCFLAGDKRSNVQPGLSSMHTIWVREHNRIADYIRRNNAGWSEEKIFQETRRLVGAEMQHITYQGFLPKVLHSFFMSFFDLNPRAAGSYFNGYNSNVKPMIRNVFATAAYRFGHSLLRDKFKWGVIFPDLHTQFNNPDLLYPASGIELCTHGIYNRISQGDDEKLSTEVTNKLFEMVGMFGGDLAAFNIQRGRDHGLPDYNKWLQGCYGLTANNFNPGVVGGLIFHDAYEAGKLAAIYGHPNDMDLFTAAMSETNLPGSKIGPTFSCILALQFRALKYGDRFFYEGNTPLNPHPFTIAELNNIRQRTLAKVICDNTDIQNLPEDVFLLPSASNPIRKCQDLPSLNLPCTPVNGGWSSWQNSNTICKQYRTCTNPTPNDCGTQCLGSSTRTSPWCILATARPIISQIKLTP